MQRREDCKLIFDDWSCLLRAVNSPFASWRLARNGYHYLLRHQTQTPPTITISGSTNWLVIRTQPNSDCVIVMRRSSCSRGRIEIRSSSDDSQFSAFSARSRLPLKARNEFAAQPELPNTTKRPSTFSLPVLYEPAAAMGKGPFLFLGSLGSIWLELKFVVATLVSQELNNLSTVVWLPVLISSERENGKPVAVPANSFTMG